MGTGTIKSQIPILRSSKKKWGQAPLNHKSLFLGLPIGFKVDSKPYLLLVRKFRGHNTKNNSGDTILNY